MKKWKYNGLLYVGYNWETERPHKGDATFFAMIYDYDVVGPCYVVDQMVRHKVIPRWANVKADHFELLEPKKLAEIGLDGKDNFWYCQFVILSMSMPELLRTETIIDVASSIVKELRSNRLNIVIGDADEVKDINRLEDEPSAILNMLKKYI